MDFDGLNSRTPSLIQYLLKEFCLSVPISSRSETSADRDASRTRSPRASLRQRRESQAVACSIEPSLRLHEKEESVWCSCIQRI